MGRGEGRGEEKRSCTNLDVLKVGRALESVVVPIEVLHPPIQVRVVVADRAEVGLEVRDVD